MSQKTRDAYERHANPALCSDAKRLGAEVVLRASGATVHLQSGRTLVDLASGGFGYGHPRVLERVAAQVRQLPLSTRLLLSPRLAELTGALARACPGDLDVVYVCNSAAEAMEGALKLALGYHPDRRRFVTLEGSHHGMSLGALSVSGLPGLRGSYQPLPLPAEVIAGGDRDALLRAINGKTSAVVLEAAQASAGVRLLPQGLLAEVSARCREVGALLILNEVVTGLGRTGSFLVCEREGVVPDVLVLGDALCAGALPIAAYVARPRVNHRVYDGVSPALHGSTTGGNPAACAAALAALEVVVAERFAEKAQRQHGLIEAALKGSTLSGRVLEITGQGLLWGLRVDDAALAAAVQQAANEEGTLVRWDGRSSGEAWVGLRPPLAITDDELLGGLQALARAFRRVAAPARVAAGASR